jgi:hypothetical protein
MQDMVWVTKNNRKIPISKMATSHIHNSINLIYKSGGKWRKEFLFRLEMEIEYRRIYGERPD